MGRSLERAHVAVADNGLETCFVVPAGHKFEVVALSISTGGEPGTAYALLDSPAIGSLQFWDQLAVPAAGFCVERGYQGLVHYEDDEFQVLWLATGTGPCVAIVTYVDVDYST